MSRRFAAPIALLCTLVLVLAACGGDDGGDDAADETTTTAEAEESTTTEGDAEATTTTEAAGESDPAEALLAADDFCDLWSTAEGSPTMALADVDTTGGAEAMEDSVALVQAFLARGADLAPDDIRADYLLVATATGEMFDLLGQYDYDFVAMAAAAESDPELQAKFDAMDSAEVQAAITTVEDWVDQNC